MFINDQTYFKSLAPCEVLWSSLSNRIFEKVMLNDKLIQFYSKRKKKKGARFIFANVVLSA